MRKSVRPILIALAAPLLLPASIAAAADPPGKPAPPPPVSPLAPRPAPSMIELFVRAPGSPASRDATKKDNLRVIDLDAQPLEDVRQHDVQYEGTRTFRGIRLSLLISRYAPPLTTDVAILHFANGMAVPLPFRDERVMSKIAPLVARGVRPESAPAAVPASTEFPPVARKVEGAPHALPITFKGNKIVVAERAHPQVPGFQQEAFSPWLYADTLVAIEFVNGGSYWRQFDVNPASRDSHDGLAAFTRSCAFCHGARRLGASLGRDFVDPTPIVDVKKTPINLFVHVRAKAGPTKSALMPSLAQVDQDDARLLHMWLRALAATPLVAYTIDPPPAPKPAPKPATPPAPPQPPPGKPAGRR